VTLIRTPSGLKNEYLFHSVDLVVYVEGAASKNISQVLAGEHETTSDDIRFWSAIFSVFADRTTIKFKAVGGKSVLIEIARLVRGASQRRTLVAMDRDFDTYIGMNLMDKHVIYTHGYSWENDTWQPEVIEDVFRFFCPGCPVAISVNAAVQTWYREITSDLRWPVYADFCLIGRSHSFQGIRGAPDSVILLDSAGSPRINSHRIKGILRGIRGTTFPTFSALVPVRLNPWQDCFGHLIDVLVYRFLVSLLRTKCARRGKFPRETFHSAAVSLLKQQLQNGKLVHLQAHYSAMLGTELPTTVNAP
jgi:hypothetical protein